MRTKRFRYIGNDSGYDLSISDLMAALCCIFVLVTISIITSLQEKNSLADKYRELQLELFLDLQKEMGNDLEKWGAKIDPETLTIRFSTEDGFEGNEAILKDGYKNVLQEFFPKLIRVLEKDKYKNEIEEIRIEGFTAPANGYDENGKLLFVEGSEEDYTTGIELSQLRTTNVLLYCLEQTNYSQETDPEKMEKEKDWIRKHIVSNGYSFSRPLGVDGKLIEEERKLTDAEKAASRRVEFRIKTNSDKIVQQFQNNMEKN